MWRLAAFMGGVLVLWIAVGSPLAAMDHHLLTAHMAQHLLLMTVAAPMILLGLAAITLPRSLKSPGALGRMFTHPVFCWLAGTAVVIGWHVPALFELGMRSARWHAFEQASFLAAGLLFWWPVIQPWPSLARLPRWGVPLYLFLATLPCDALSAFLTFSGRVVYPHYLSAHRAFDISALGDQECAGALMWVWVTFAYLAPAAAVTIQLLSPHRRPEPPPRLSGLVHN
jgi:putative membrane protein